MKTIPFAILGAFMALLLALYALPQQTGAQGNTPCISLGQYDTADLWFNGAYWLQTGESDN